MGRQIRRNAIHGKLMFNNIKENKHHNQRHQRNNLNGKSATIANWPQTVGVEAARLSTCLHAPVEFIIQFLWTSDGPRPSRFANI